MVNFKCSYQSHLVNSFSGLFKFFLLIASIIKEYLFACRLSYIVGCVTESTYKGFR